MISVIIPLYNKEPIIEQSLQSVLSQDYDDFEVIVVNDGSTDKSAEIVKSIKDPRITLIEQKNGGPSKARNTGVRHAKGEWILFLDADDELTTDALKLIREDIDRYSDADIIDFNGYIGNGKSKKLRNHPLTGKIDNPVKEFFFRNISPGCGHSVFKADFVKMHPYDEKLRRFEDCEILLRMLSTGKVYSSQHITEIHNANYAEASNVRKYIREDFAGNLSMKGKTFWQKMCVYQIFLFERNNYPEIMPLLYPTWYYRYDLFIIYKFLNYFNKFF